MLYKTNNNMSLSASVWINDTPGSSVRRTLKQPPVRTLPEREFATYTPSGIEPMTVPDTPLPADRVSAMLAKLEATSTNNTDESGLADFRAVAMPPQSVQSTVPIVKSTTQISGAQPGTQQNFSNYERSYGSQIIGAGTGGSTRIPDPQAWMMDKISYLVHLAEQQHRAPTRYIAEEFILYLLFGVFVIFVVDGFARSGVYRR